MTTPARQGRAYQRPEIEDLLRVALADALRGGASFREVSVERLCVAAGIARSTFYLYFPDKAAMLHALSAGAMLRLYKTQRSWLAKGEDATFADVRASMRAVFAAFHADEAIMFAVAEAAGYEPSLREGYEDAVNDYARAIERYIKAGQQGGWVRDSATAATATVLAWMVEGTVAHLGRSATPHRIRASADAMADVVWTTLRE
ncbi:MAG: TetR/AcrR family transcriptional regulator [Sporichthyaceae bacterium]